MGTENNSTAANPNEMNVVERVLGCVVRFSFLPLPAECHLGLVDTVSNFFDDGLSR